MAYGMFTFLGQRKVGALVALMMLTEQQVVQVVVSTHHRGPPTRGAFAGGGGEGGPPGGRVGLLPVFDAARPVAGVEGCHGHQVPKVGSSVRPPGNRGARGGVTVVTKRDVVGGSGIE